MALADHDDCHHRPGSLDLLGAFPARRNTPEPARRGLPLNPERTPMVRGGCRIYGFSWSCPTLADVLDPVFDIVERAQPGVARSPPRSSQNAGNRRRRPSALEGSLEHPLRRAGLERCLGFTGHHEEVLSFAVEQFLVHRTTSAAPVRRRSRRVGWGQRSAPTHRRFSRAGSISERPVFIGHKREPIGHPAKSLPAVRWPVSPPGDTPAVSLPTAGSRCRRILLALSDGGWMPASPGGVGDGAAVRSKRYCSCLRPGAPGHWFSWSDAPGSPPIQLRVPFSPGFQITLLPSGDHAGS